jgi:hypothetical protein
MLRVRGRDIRLLRQMLIGRTSICAIRFETDLLVSREHARLTVRPEGVFVEDLGSSNGTFVNKIRLISKRLLLEGDVLRVGSQEMMLHRGASEPCVDASTRPEIPAWSAPRDSDGNEDEGAMSCTARQNVFDVIASSADGLMLQQKWDEAACLLRPCFDKILREAQVSRELPRAVQEPACAFAMNLARATRRGEWIDYIVRLHSILPCPMPVPVIAMLPELVRNVDRIDVEGLRAYAFALRAVQYRLSPVERQLCGQIESLLVVATSSRGW